MISGHEELTGTLLTDYRVEPGSPTLTEGIFPADGVALSLARGLPLYGTPPRLQLPLSPQGLREHRHPDGTAWNGVFGLHGWLYAISLWIGRASPRHDRATVESALASIRSAA